MEDSTLVTPERPTDGGELSRLLRRSKDLEAAIDQILDENGAQFYDDSPRLVVAVAAALVSVEHGEALRALLAHPFPTSAISLLRLQHEALTRAVWLYYAASDEQVDRLASPLDAESQKAASKLPMISAMLTAMVGKAPAGAVEMLAHFKDVAAPALHSFVHGGIHAIQRGLTGYPALLLHTAVRNSNGLYTMAGMLLAILTGDESKAKRMRQIQPQFADCLPPLGSRS